MNNKLLPASQVSINQKKTIEKIYPSFLNETINEIAEKINSAKTKEVHCTLDKASMEQYPNLQKDIKDKLVENQYSVKVEKDTSYLSKSNGNIDLIISWT